MRFEFTTAQRILFGPGVLQEAAPLAATLGRSALLVTGRDFARAYGFIASLSQQGVIVTGFPVIGEPTVDTIRQGVEAAQQSDCALVIGFGGGSALDTAKAVAALMTNGGDLLDYVEVIGKNQPLTRTSLPTIAIPTTAGTGAEVTRNAVIGFPEHQIKVSLRGPTLLPSIALIDPELTRSLPPVVTAYTGLDALTQLIEAYTSQRANPLTDALCREGIQRAARALQRACENGEDMEAREDMALASLFSGIALTNAGLGVVHGIASPLGGLFPIPHGAACGGLLTAAMRVNLQAFRRREPNNGSRTRYEEVARLLTGIPQASADDGVAWIQALCQALYLPPLGTYGIQPAHFPTLIARAQATSSMKGNPILLEPEELQEILETSL